MSCNVIGHKAFDENCVGCKDFEECFKKKLPAFNKYVEDWFKRKQEKFKSNKRVNDEIIGKYDILKVWKHYEHTMQEECPYCGAVIDREVMSYLTSYKSYICCPYCYTFSKIKLLAADEGE